MNRIITSVIALILVPLFALGSDKEEIFSAFGIDGPDRESKVSAIDLHKTEKGKELYGIFVAFFESHVGPVEFHDLKTVYPSTILYELDFLRKYFEELNEKEGTEKEDYLRKLKTWKTQGLIGLTLKMKFIEQWNESREDVISLHELHSDLIDAVTAERQYFLNIPNSLAIEENEALKALLKEMKLDTELYDEMLTYLSSSDYESAHALASESEDRIKNMDALNQQMHRIMWPAWNIILTKIEGANQSGDDNSE